MDGKNVRGKRERAWDRFGLHGGIKAEGISGDEVPREKLFWDVEESDI